MLPVIVRGMAEVTVQPHRRSGWERIIALWIIQSEMSHHQMNPAA